MPKTLVCTLWTKKITKNTVGSRGRVSSFVRKPLYVSFWRYTEFHTWKKSRNSVKFRGISRNYTSRNSAEFRRNCSQFRAEYGIDGSKKNRRNSVSSEFRGHPSNSKILDIEKFACLVSLSWLERGRYLSLLSRASDEGRVLRGQLLYWA